MFVFVGSSACRRCQELDEQILRSGSVATELNRRFVSVRVDSEERPDVAMTYARATDKKGRIDEPLMVVTTPDSHQVGSGPFPLPEELAETASFLRWLADSANKSPSAPRADLARRDFPASTSPLASATAALPRAASAARTYAGEAAASTPLATEPGDTDVRPGELSSTVRLLLADVGAGKGESLRGAVAILDFLASGGLRDHVGGGFHHAAAPGGRRAVAFEKLLCDNALLLRAYADGYTATQNLVYRDVARETATWTLRELKDSSGLFWTSVNSTTEGENGRFYLWREEEIADALGAGRTEEFFRAYRLVPPGVLNLFGSPFAGLGSFREVLAQRRGLRVRPAIDEKVLTGWNGLMIGALSASGLRLRRGSDLDAARRAAGVLLERVGPPGLLRHYSLGSATQGSADLADYAYLAEGLVDLSEATGETRWRETAAALVDAAILRFWDATRGGFYLTDARHLPLPGRLIDGGDADLPSPNGVMATVLLRLGHTMDVAKYRELGRRTINAFRFEMEHEPGSTPTLARAVLALEKAAPSPTSPGAR